MGSPARANRFVRDSFGLFSTQLVVTALGVVTSVITARMLAPDGRGIFQAVVLLPTTLSNFAKFGIPQASVYCIRRRGVPTSVVASHALWIGIILGVGMSLLCWFGRSWLLAHLMRGVPEQFFPAALVMLPFVVLQTYFLGVLQAEERFGEY